MGFSLVYLISEALLPLLSSRLQQAAALHLPLQRRCSSVTLSNPMICYDLFPVTPASCFAFRYPPRQPKIARLDFFKLLMYVFYFGFFYVEERGDLGAVWWDTQMCSTGQS